MRRVRRRDARASAPPASVREREVGAARRRAKTLEQVVDVLDRRGLVERDADRAVVELAQVDPPRSAAAASTSSAGRAAPSSTRRVSKNGSRADVVARAGAARRRAPRPARGPARAMRAQPLGAVVDGVHAGHDRQQHLRGADVARRLLAADVLLAGLQGHAAAPACPWRSRETPMSRPGHLALVLVAGGEEGGVRTAEAHRHAEALRRADRDVGAELARAAAAGSARAGRWPPPPVRLAAWARSTSARVVDDPAVGGRVLQEDAEDVAARSRPTRRVADPDLDADGRAARVSHHRDASAGGSRRRRRRPLRVARRHGRGTCASPRPRPSPRRAARRWRPAGRSGRRPWSGS